MAIFFGQSSAHGVHTAFANKHMYAIYMFDMCFKLIDLSTHVRVVKQNDCGPVTAFPQSHFDFNNINQVLLLKAKENPYLRNFGSGSHIPLDLILGYCKTAEGFCP